MKKILFITPLFPPDSSIGTQRIVKFIKYLSYKEWKVYVLTLHNKYYSEQSDNYAFYVPTDINITRINQFGLFDRIFLLWGRLKQILREKESQGAVRHSNAYSSSTTSGRPTKSILYEAKELVSNLLQFPDQYNGFSINLVTKAYKIIRRNHIPYVFLSSPPHSPYIPLNLLRKWVHFTYIVDFRDPWALSQWQEDQNHLYQKIEKKLEKRLERRTLQRADLVIFNTEYLKQTYKDFYTESQINSKFHVITNGFDPEIKLKFNSNNTQNIENDNFDKINILHTGTLYKKRNPQSIIEGLAEFIKQSPEFRDKIEIRFIGTVTKELHFLYEYVAQMKLGSMVKFQPPLTYQQIIEETQTSHWLILLQPGTKIQIPGKLFDYLLVNKPIWGVLEKESIGQKILQELNLGFFSQCDSLESIISFFRFVTSGSWSFQPNEKNLLNYAMPKLVDRLERIMLDHNKLNESGKITAEMDITYEH